MRFRINRTFSGPDGTRYVAGDVVDLVPGKVDEVWVKAGLIMQDKSLDAPAETKDVEPVVDTITTRIPSRSPRRRGK